MFCASAGDADRIKSGYKAICKKIRDTNRFLGGISLKNTDLPARCSENDIRGLLRCQQRILVASIRTVCFGTVVATASSCLHDSPEPQATRSPHFRDIQ